MHSASFKLEPRTKDNAKKCVQAFFAVPGPVVDYAFNLAAALDSSPNSSSSSSSLEDANSLSGSFALRKMDSGQFGEHSLTLLASPSGRGSKHRRLNTFGDASKLSFSCSPPSSPHK